VNRFAYRIYYEYKGANPSDEFRSEKSPEAIAESLADFPSVLRHFLPDDAAVWARPIVGDPRAIYVAIETTLDEASADRAVADCLRRGGLDLFSDRLERS
jgi:hypothetical protein